jgi:ribosomal protein L2
MALVKMKPTSPGRRGMVKVVNPTCTRAVRSLAG